MIPDNEHIDVLISTYGQRISRLNEVIPSTIKEGVNYIVCHQEPGSFNLPEGLFFREDVLYFRLNSSGVTKSRNFALQRSKSHIKYFCDDDVKLSLNFEELLRKFSHLNKSCVVMNILRDDDLMIGSSKVSSSLKRLTKYNILSVGTVRIALYGFRSGDAWFPEDMGAGATFPVGDEAVFLGELARMKYLLFGSNNYIAAHPSHSSGALVSRNACQARGMTFRRVFGKWAFFLGILFLVRRAKLFFEKDPVASIKNIITFLKACF